MTKAVFVADKEKDMQVKLKSRVFDEKEIEIVRGLLLQEKSVANIYDELVGINVKWGRVKKARVTAGIKAIMSQIITARKNNWLTENKPVDVSVNDTIEQKEKKLFEGVFDNVRKAEYIKTVSLGKLAQKAMSSGLGPRALKDLAVMQAIGMRELNSYKQKRSGKLEKLTDAELMQTKDEIVKYFMMSKGGKKIEIKTTETLPETGNVTEQKDEVPEVVEEVESRIVPEAAEGENTGKPEAEEDIGEDL